MNRFYINFIPNTPNPFHIVKHKDIGGPKLRILKNHIIHKTPVSTLPKLNQALAYIKNKDSKTP